MSTTPPPVCSIQFKLNNGHSIPAVGLGTWQGQKGTSESDALKSSIVHALHCGYRHIDTAQSYGVEDVIGEAIRESGVPRSEIFLVTKFWSEWHHDPATALQNSLATLKLDYVDLFLMHWPQTLSPDGEVLGPEGKPTIIETWKMMEGLAGSKCKSIGVSNFSQRTLDTLLQEAKIPPAVNQVELHALNPNFKLLPYCQEKGIHVTSWSTMGGPADPKLGTKKNEIMTNPLFTGIAEKYGISTGVVSLSWAVQRGVSVIPKSSNPKRIEENIRLVTLSDDDMQTINSAHEQIGKLRLANNISVLQSVDAQGRPGLLGWTYEDLGWEDSKGNWLL